MPTADELLPLSLPAELAAILGRVRPGVDLPTVRALGATLADTAFGRRATAISEALQADLPADFAEVESWVTDALADQALRGWMIMPLADAVAVRAVAQPAESDAFERGLALMAALTGRLSAEFAIRAFLAADAARTFAVVADWVQHPDEHVRRLASEGTRPNLPWGRRVAALTNDPHPALPLLRVLAADPIEYVRRSAANHLNDRSRDHADLVVVEAAAWQAAGVPEATVRHALRTLVKQGNQEALGLLGFRPAPAVRVTGPVLGSPEVAVGEALPFVVVLQNEGESPAAVVVDYVVHHRKANGTTTPKVFKLAKATLAPGERITWRRQHSFRPITTRRYHSGGHRLAVQVNGVAGEEVPFTLTDA